MAPGSNNPTEIQARCSVLQPLLDCLTIMSLTDTFELFKQCVSDYICRLGCLQDLIGHLIVSEADAANLNFLFPGRQKDRQV